MNVWSVLVLMAASSSVAGNPNPAATVVDAAHVLQEIQQIPARGIPLTLLQKAEGVAVIPGVIKAGFVIGGRHGRGVLVARDPARSWTFPVFIEITGASIGWQAGAQSTDVVLIFTTRRSVDGFLRGHKITLGADAAIAAGPVGRRAEAGTDTHLSAEILSYSRSRGLFAGVSLGGAKLSVDQQAATAYYGVPGLTTGQILSNQLTAVPQEAFTFVQQLAVMTGLPVPVPAESPPLPETIPPGPPVMNAQPGAPTTPVPQQPVIIEDEVATGESALIAAATEAVSASLTLKENGIPISLLKQAHAVAVFPDLMKAGFVVGGRFGRGIVVVKAPGGFSAPVFLKLTGGSIGWQAGAQASDVVLVFTSSRGLDAMLRQGSFTLGADAAVAAGPLGRQAEAATNLTLNAEIYSYSRTRGLFAGLAIEGGMISIDYHSMQQYYQVQNVSPAAVLAGQLTTLPKSALQLPHLLSSIVGDMPVAQPPESSPVTP